MTSKITFALFTVWLSWTGLLYGDDFYKSNSIRVIVGGSAGGGFDIYARAMARHMGKHIPGNPTLTVETKTGDEVK